MDKSKIPTAESDALTALIEDHRAVKRQFKAFQDAGERSEKSDSALEVCRALTVHSTLKKSTRRVAGRQKSLEEEGCAPKRNPCGAVERRGFTARCVRHARRRLRSTIASAGKSTSRAAWMVFWK